MSIKLTKRTAAKILERGVNSIRIKEGAIEEAEKAITREDVRNLIKNGSVYAMQEKHNISMHGKLLGEKRAGGRKRGPGRKRGTRGARTGILYKKKIRAQRRVLEALKSEKAIDNVKFKKFYALVKGGTFQTKISLLHHVRSQGVQISDEKAEKLRHI